MCYAPCAMRYVPCAMRHVPRANALCRPNAALPTPPNAPETSQASVCRLR